MVLRFWVRRSLALLWSQPLTNKERQQCQQLVAIVLGDKNTDKPCQLVLSHRKREFSGVSRFVPLRSCQHLDSVSEGSPGVISWLEQHCPRHQSTMERAVSILPSPFNSMLATLKFCLQQKENPNRQPTQAPMTNIQGLEAPSPSGPPRYIHRPDSEYPVQSPLLCSSTLPSTNLLTSPQL